MKTLLMFAESGNPFVAVSGFVEAVFGGDVPNGDLELYQIAARAAVVYLIGVFLVRIGKSRGIGRGTTLDVIFAFILGSLLSRGITGHASLSGTIVASAAIVACHWAMTAIAYRSHAFGKFWKGSPRQVVKDGKMLEEALAKSHISDHDLLSQMRLAGIRDLSEVAEAYKERNGEISFIRCKDA
jgi:uncharacterized membrane protein YcaP (DUF421 family)